MSTRSASAAAQASIALTHGVRPTAPKYSGDRSHFLQWEMLLTNYLSLSFGIGKLTFSSRTGTWSLPIDDQITGQLIVQCLSGSALRDAHQVPSGTGSDIMVCLRQKYLGSSALQRSQYHRRLQDVRYVPSRSFVHACESFRDSINTTMDLYVAFGGTPDIEVVRTCILQQLPMEFVPILDEIASHATNDYTSFFDRIIQYAEICDLRRGDHTAQPGASPAYANTVSPRACHSCGTVGHFARNCPTHKRQQHPNAGSTQRPQQRSAQRTPSQRPKRPPPTPCRHCSGDHWNRDCPRRHTSTTAHVTTASPSTPAARPAPGPPSPQPSSPTHSPGDTALVSSTGILPSSMNSDTPLDHPSVTFVVDGACTAPVVHSKAHLANFRAKDDLPPFVTGSGEHIPVLGVGDIVQFAHSASGQPVSLTIPGVRFAPQFTCNLLPESLLVQDLGAQIAYTRTAGKSLLLSCGSEVPLRYSNGLHHLDLYCPQIALATPTATSKPPAPPASGPPAHTLQTLHKLFGHRNYGSLRHLAANQHWQLAISDEDFACDVCSRVNAMRRTQYKTAPGFRPDRPGVVMATDYIGPFPAAYGGYDGAIVFVDAFSKATFVYCVRDRTADTFLTVFAQMQLDAGFRAGQDSYGPLVMQSDTDKVIWSSAVQEVFLKAGIRTRSSPPHVHEQNGLVERHIRTLKKSTRALLLDSKLPPEFWPYALQHAALLLRLSSSRPDGITPYQLHFDIQPDIDAMIPAAFGTRCYAYDGRWPQRKSLHTQPGLVATYLGNSVRSKSFLVWPHKKGRTDLHRECDSVIFPHTTTKLTAAAQLDQVQCISGHLHSSESLEDPATPHDVGDPPIVSRRFWPQEMLSGPTAHSYLIPAHDESPPAAHDTAHFLALDTHTELEHAASDLDPPHALITEIVYHDYAQAKASGTWDSWKTACDAELQAMTDHGVFEFVDQSSVPSHVNIVKSRMLFASKHNSDGTLQKRKARLVAKGFTQQKYLDYLETSAPTPRDSTWRIVLLLSVTLGFFVSQYDVKTAFLNADLHHDVYMQLPKGLEKRGKTGQPLIAKLKKSLYGLKQSAHEWYRRLNTTILGLGFHRSQLDQCLYFQGTDDSRIYIVTYVDDLLIAASSETAIATVVDQLKLEFTLTGGDPIKSFLGISVSYDRAAGTVQLSQSGYIDSIADQFPDIKDTKPLKTPLGPSDRFHKSNQPKEPLPDILRQYRSLLGALIYASVKTRPDISFAIGRAASVMSNPGLEHWNLLWKIFRYTYHSRSTSLYLRRSPPSASAPFLLTAYSDSDWATDISSRKSISGYLCVLGGSAITWKSRQQTSIALSSSQAETIAASFACREIVYLRRLLTELGYPQQPPTALMVDSQATIDSATHPMTSSRMKHVAVADLWCRDLKERGEITMKKIAGTQNPADIFTKSLGSLLFDRHKASIMEG
eukprot:m.1068730 g.1068730  ORF g.1068730 m.1068730 type:complete len:1436 (+) comp24226_c0_seq4:346-4653(+)